MKLLLENYPAQKERWPETGRHILAQYDDEHVVVYQAYRLSIGRFAVQHGHFGGPDYKLTRMSWIKPNFLWMMYRSGWGTKPGQETTLAIWLKRSAFKTILAQAIHSSYVPGVYSSQEDWKQALATSTVRLQWDPDHNPSGDKIERRAIQLGLRDETLKQFAQGNWIVHIEDISDFVSEQRSMAHSPYTDLKTPQEYVYQPLDKNILEKLQLSS